MSSIMDPQTISDMDRLRIVAPLLRVLDADQVDHLALLQLVAIGGCFPSKLSETFDTCIADHPWGLQESTNGRAAALLSFFLVHNLDENNSATLLNDLSAAILPADSIRCSKADIGHAAAIMSKELGAKFKKIWESHVADIRTTLRSFLCDAPTLFNTVAVEMMLQFFLQLSNILSNKRSPLRIDGCEGIGRLVTFAMAFCPDDLCVRVHEKIVFQGKRDLVNILLKSEGTMKIL
jgi:hypothetical protein